MAEKIDERWVDARELREGLKLTTGRRVLVHVTGLAGEKAGVLSGTVEGPYGPLRNWPFHLTRAGTALAQSDLGDATTSNEFTDLAWLTDAEGCYRFEGLSAGDYRVDLMLPGEP